MMVLRSYGFRVLCCECGEMFFHVYAETPEAGERGQGLCPTCYQAKVENKRSRKVSPRKGEITLARGTLVAATVGESETQEGPRADQGETDVEDLAED